MKNVSSQLLRGVTRAGGRWSRMPYGMPIELLSAVSIPIPESAHPHRSSESRKPYDVLSDPQRRHDHDIDLARSRAYSRVRPEPLIPETPTHVVFRPSTEPLIPKAPVHVVDRPAAFEIDEQIVRMFQMMEDIFGQIW